MKAYIIFLFFLAILVSGAFAYILGVAILAIFLWTFILFIWTFIPSSM